MMPPNTDPDPASALLSLPPPRMAQSTLARLVSDHWGLTGTLTPLTSERDLNHRLDASTATGTTSFTVKLSNPAEAAALTDFQTRALLHAAAADAGLPTPRVLPTREGLHILATPDGALRLLTWCPGTPVAHLPRTPALARATGAALARLTIALSDFEHPAADHSLLWDLRQFPRLRPLLPALPADLAPIAKDFLQRFEDQIAPALARLPRQIVHADFNPHNLLADPAQPDRLTGILDFGDMVLSHRICDLATACSYQIDPAEPLHLLAPLVSAYHAHLPLTEAETALLPGLITARMLTTLTISAWRAARYPENAAYILRNAPSARAGLAAATSLTPTQIQTACERPTP